MKQPVTIIGTGRMGSALAAALHKNGIPTTVWNRTASKAELLARLGIRVAGSLEEAVRVSDVIVLIVSNYSTGAQLLQPAEVASVLKGKVLVQLTTGTPHEPRRKEAWAHERGASYLDGAIMSYPSGIGKPECTVYYSGSKEVYDRVKPVLMTFGGNTMHVGTAIGHASAYDMAGLTFVMGAMFGFVGGHVISTEEGIPGEAYMESVKGILPTLADMLAGIASSIQSGRYAGDEATIDAWTVGPREYIEWCQERSIRHEIAGAQQKLFDSALKNGKGEMDFAYFFEIMRKAAEPAAGG